MAVVVEASALCWGFFCVIKKQIDEVKTMDTYKEQFYYLDPIYISVDINRRTFILGKRGQSLSFFIYIVCFTNFQDV
jgi:hypothetical protein